MFYSTFHLSAIVDLLKFYICLSHFTLYMFIHSVEWKSTISKVIKMKEKPLNLKYVSGLFTGLVQKLWWQWLSFNCSLLLPLVLFYFFFTKVSNVRLPLTPLSCDSDTVKASCSASHPHPVNRCLCAFHHLAWKQHGKKIDIKRELRAKKAG